MKIVCIGHATYDTIVSLDNFPKENTKTRILETVGKWAEKNWQEMPTHI